MGEELKPFVVISGVNFIEGGPLAIMKDAVHAFLLLYKEEFNLVLIVHSRKLFPAVEEANVIFYEYPNVKSSWFRRLWFEYFECKKISRKIKPYLWLAMHDITPSVVCERKAVYCHNAAPFYRVSLKETLSEPTLFLFSLFYKYLYKINIRTNDFVIVQQDWIRQHFLKKYNAKNVVVAHPSISFPIVEDNKVSDDGLYTFLYPAFPRVFKNFEVLLEAVAILSNIRSDFQVLITITGNESGYATQLKRRYDHLERALFIGLQPREKVLELYAQSDALVFPSKLETWGLPISEMKLHNKPILVADRPYAVETVGKYAKVKFFNPDDPKELSGYMNQLINKTIHYDNREYVEPSQPYVKNWLELMRLLLN